MGWVDGLCRRESGGVGEDAAWSYTRLQYTWLLLVNLTACGTGRWTRQGAYGDDEVETRQPCLVLTAGSPRSPTATSGKGRTRSTPCAGGGLACEASILPLGGMGCVGDTHPTSGRVALPYDDCMLPCRATGTPPDQAVGCTGIETSQDSLCRLPPGEDGWDGRPNHDTARRRFVGAAWG